MDTSTHRPLYIVLYVFIAYTVWRELVAVDDDSFIVPNARADADPIIDQSSGKEIVFQTYRYKPDVV